VSGAGSQPHAPREGDVLFSVEGVPTPDAAAARKALAAIPEGKDAEVGLMRRDGPGAWRYEGLVVRREKDGDAWIAVVKRLAR
jgi:hypothetical protein